MTLTAERWTAVRRVYESALDLPLEHRALYLDEACGSDRELRNEVESLLSAQGKAEDFLSRPVVDLKANPESMLGKSDRTGQSWVPIVSRP